MLNRITPKMVIDAYKKTMLFPDPSSYGELKDGLPCGCGIAAVVLANDEQLFAYLVSGMPVDWKVMQQVESEYRDGFTTGFFGNGYRRYSELGYQDGLAARRAVFGD